MSEILPAGAAWRVVVFGRPDDLHEVADILAQRLGIHPTDALLHARAAPGLLRDRLPEPLAAEIVADLAGAGLAAAAVPESEIPELEHAPHLHHVRCVEEGLQVLDLRGDLAEVVPWGDLRLLSVGVVPEDKARRLDANDRVVRSGPHLSAPARQFPITEGPEAWLIAADPPRVMRIDHLQMNYEYLGERMASSASANFRLLVEDLAAWAPHVHRTPATRAWLEHLPAEKYRFADSTHLESDTLLHWLMLRPANPVRDDFIE